MPNPLDLNSRYDVLIIGGGVHGAATALEAARMGYKVLIVEKHDFCSQTSANSLKIIHGGLRYLQSLDIRRSRESAKEQHRLLNRAANLVSPLPCLIPTDRSVTRGKLAMSLGLWFYDTVICRGLPSHIRGGMLSVEEVTRLCHYCPVDYATGVALWYEAQVKDSERLVLAYLKTAEIAGAHIRNYVSATHVKTGNGVSVTVRDEFSGELFDVIADIVIDTGSFLDPHPAWTRAVNLVVDRDVGAHAFGAGFRGGPSDSRRLYFSTPLNNATIIGTWYFPDRRGASDRPDEVELKQCLSDVDRLFPMLEVTMEDIIRVHVGRLPVRDAANPLSLLEKPIIRTVKGEKRVVNVTGVKYTSAGPTARRTLRTAGLFGMSKNLRDEPWYGTTASVANVEGTIADVFADGSQGVRNDGTIRRLSRQYGSAAVDIVEMAARLPGGFEPIPGCDGIRAEIDYCIEQEHCKTAADFLLRRSGIGALSRPSPDVIEYCVTAMAGRFDWSESRIEAELTRIESAYNLPLPNSRRRQESFRK